MDKVQNIEINYDPLFYKTLIYFNKQENINFQPLRLMDYFVVRYSSSG